MILVSRVAAACFCYCFDLSFARLFEGKTGLGGALFDVH